MEEFRRCLYCQIEIAPGRPNHTNFCNGVCQARFSKGMPRNAYHYAVEVNKQKPIRGALSPKAKRKSKASISRMCAYPPCPVIFTTHISKKLYCTWAHQVKHYTLKRKEELKTK